MLSVLTLLSKYSSINILTLDGALRQSLYPLLASTAAFAYYYPYTSQKLFRGIDGSILKIFEDPKKSIFGEPPDNSTANPKSEIYDDPNKKDE